MDQRFVLRTLSPFSKIVDQDVEDINALLKHLSPRALEVSWADILEVIIKENLLFVVRDFTAPRGGNYRIVAMATLHPKRLLTGYSGLVEDVVVHPDYEGRGIGTWLNQQLILEAKLSRMEHLDLTSSPDREAANHLYQKLGYELRRTNPYRKKLE